MSGKRSEIKSLTFTELDGTKIEGYSIRMDAKMPATPKSITCAYDPEICSLPSDQWLVESETVKSNITMYAVVDVIPMDVKRWSSLKGVARCTMEMISIQRGRQDGEPNVVFGGYHFTIEEARIAWERMSTTRASIRDVAVAIGKPGSVERASVIMEFLNAGGHVTLDRDDRKGRAYKVNVPLTDGRLRPRGKNEIVNVPVINKVTAADVMEYREKGGT